MSEILYSKRAAGSQAPSVYTPQNRISDSLAHANCLLPLISKLPELPYNSEAEAFQLQYNDLAIALRRGSEAAAREAFGAISPATSKVLDILSDICYRTKNGSFVLSLAEYMRKTGLKDRKYALETLDRELNFLYEAELVFNPVGMTPKERKSYSKKNIAAYQMLSDEKSFSEVAWRILDLRCVRKKNTSVFPIVFSKTYEALVQAYKPMCYNSALLRTNDKKNPASYHLGRLFEERFNIKLSKAISAARLEAKKSGKPYRPVEVDPSVTIGIPELLEVARNIPTEEQVVKGYTNAEGKYIKGNRNTRLRIIAPLERDLTALSELGVGNWSYQRRVINGKGGEPVSREEAAKLDFSEWKELLVRFEKLDYKGGEESREEGSAVIENKPDNPVIDLK